MPLVLQNIRWKTGIVALDPLVMGKFLPSDQRSMFTSIFEAAFLILLAMAGTQLIESLAALVGFAGLGYACLRISVPAEDPISRFWSSQPVVGPKNRRFLWLRNTMKSITRTQEMVAEGYAKVGSCGIID